jgi:hypothetical protein
MVKTGNIRDLTQDELQKRNGQSSLSILGQSESVKGVALSKKISEMRPTGFEFGTCRRGDRTKNPTCRVHRGLVLICNTAPFSRVRRGSKSSRCATKSMECHARRFGVTGIIAPQTVIDVLT